MERQRKLLKDLTLKDNFMFAAVMMDAANAKGLLELVLGVKLSRVQVSKEKSIVYNPEYRGVRLDVYVEDAEGTHFNVEMQTTSQRLERRARYYHSQMDMELLTSGTDYEQLPESFVIFICDFDPLGLKKYKYTVRSTLEEDGSYSYRDGMHTIFLSTVGTNSEEVPEALVKFLRFAGSDINESESNFNDSFVEQLQNSVSKIKNSRDMEGRYMLLEEMLKDEYKTGREDGLAEGEAKGKIEGKIEGKIDTLLSVLSFKYTISDNLMQRIRSVSDVKMADLLVQEALKSASVTDFEAALDKYGL